MENIKSNKGITEIQELASDNNKSPKKTGTLAKSKEKAARLKANDQENSSQKLPNGEFEGQPVAHR